MPMLVAGLQSIEPRRWKKDIVEHGVYEFLRMRLDDANESATAIKRLESTQSDFRHACAKPFRWACRQFWKTHRYHVLGILFVAFVILISWAKLWGNFVAPRVTSTPLRMRGGSYTLGSD